MKIPATVQTSPGGLIVRTPYNPAFVASLKASIPTAGRAWDSASKAWIVAPNYAVALNQVLAQYYPGVSVPAAAGAIPTPLTETRLLEVRYIGATKDRGDDVRTAFGYADSGWSVIFPEPELRRWFGQDVGDSRASASATLYQVLAVSKAATTDEIKAAWRRMARQWHPDVCREPDAAAQFRRIQEAYEVLTNGGQRARYDAGLAMEQSMTRVAQYSLPYALVDDGFRPPLRCGYILAEGHEQLARFVVSRILAWEDITDRAGRTLVTSWPAGAKMFEEAWS